MTGAGTLGEVKSWIYNPEQASGLGHAFIAINIQNILPIQSFKERMDSVIQRLHDAPKAKGSERVYAPGEIEWEKRADALKNGIELPENVSASLHRAAELVGVDTELLN